MNYLAMSRQELFDLTSAMLIAFMVLFGLMMIAIFRSGR